jgi:hypothetical protein
MYCIRYDDSEEEWLNLSEEYFKYVLSYGEYGKRVIMSILV